MDVRFHPEAETELEALPTREKVAMLSAVEKLEALGDRLLSPIRARSGVGQSFASFAPELDDPPGELSIGAFRERWLSLRSARKLSPIGGDSTGPSRTPRTDSMK